jgi:hypothetical protein
MGATYRSTMEVYTATVSSLSNLFRRNKPNKTEKILELLNHF